jgi:hypothetical protein
VTRAGYALAALVFAGMVASAVWVCCRWDGQARLRDEPVRQKQYERLVAEGVRCRDYQNFGHDLLSFKSCRVEKRRSGALTFGGFNVLVVDELVVNLPAEPAEQEEVHVGEALLSGRFAASLLLSQGQACTRFSGIRINGLTINRCSSNRVSLVFSAARAESGTGGDELRLSECVETSEAGGEERVRDARLEVKPELALVFQAGGDVRRVRLASLTP